MDGMTPSETNRLELAITELRGAMDAALARIEGRLDLLVQRAEHSDAHAAAQDQRLDRHDERLDALERTAVTRDDLDRSRARTIQALSVVVALIGIGVSAGTSVVIAFLTQGG